MNRCQESSLFKAQRELPRLRTALVRNVSLALDVMQAALESEQLPRASVEIKTVDVVGYT